MKPKYVWKRLLVTAIECRPRNGRMIRIPDRRWQARQGFALIVTLSMMILLVVIAVGLLSLSSISLRTGDPQHQMRTAQANARLAMMLAISELQKELGPDQRITATSGILDDPDPIESNPNLKPLTGVWDSRKVDPNRNPDLDLDELNVTAPTYGPNEGFRRWLVSSSDSQTLSDTAFAINGSFQDPVELVSARTPAAQPAPAPPFPAVQAGRISVQGANKMNKGKLAWWVGDENCKGFINPTASEHQQAGATVSEVLANTQTPGAYGMQVLDQAFPANTDESAKLVTHAQVALATTQARATTNAWFHELSPYPRSVLTNVAKGGLRKDLNLCMEQERYEIRRNDTDKGMPVWPMNLPGGNYENSCGPNGKIALSEEDKYDVLGWKHLSAWMRLRRDIQMDNGRPTLHSHDALNNTPSNDRSNPRWNAGVMRPAPIPIRCLQFISVGTFKDPASNTCAARLYVYPVVVLWNPYNVDLTASYINILFSSMPVSIDGKVKPDPGASGYRRDGTYKWISRDGTSGLGVQPYFDTPILLRSGEIKILTPGNWKGTDNIHIAHKMSTAAINYTSTRTKPDTGVTGAGGEWGNLYPAADPGFYLAGQKSDTFTIEVKIKNFSEGGASHDVAGGSYATTFDIRVQHAGIVDAQEAWPRFMWSSKVGWRHDKDVPISPDMMGQSAKFEVKFEDLIDKPRPFMVVDAKLKTMDEDGQPNKTWSQCIPAHAFQGVTKGQGATPIFANAYKLTYLPVSSMQQVLSYLQTNPEDSTQSYSGGSDFPSKGQSSITDVEIPMAPLTSLAQLQHLPQGSIDNLKSSGLFFQNHAIGNSFASPGVPSDRIKSSGWPFWVDKYYQEGNGLANPTTGGSIRGIKYPGSQFLSAENIDRSYVANHLLWDDYFFSSIGPKDGVLAGAEKGTTIDKVVKDFYNGQQSLPNERYKPYFYKPAGQIITDLVSGTSPTVEGYKKVAASLLADGGFNVNSTSVTAWKTLLASAHNRPMAILKAKEGEPLVQDPANFIVSHFTMPNGPVTKTLKTQTENNPQWNGYHELTDTQLDALAHAIVRQVKARGPFRSLAEFINRQLRSDQNDDRALCGALQAALDDPGVDINAAYRNLTVNKTLLQEKGVEYANMAAATKGSIYQGAPDYVSQADLLGPIAPILNARSDTFVIRAYGEATGTDGLPVARAWCEAVVQRVPDFMDAADTPEAAAAAPLNKLFGRRIQVINFRWLTPNEI